jgi:hypothetical protein
MLVFKPTPPHQGRKGTAPATRDPFIDPQTPEKPE